MLDCKLKLQMTMNDELLKQPQLYQRMVGKVIYLIITQPDISRVVNLISQFMHSHTTNHMLIFKRILRYLKGSIGCDFLMKNNGHI
jgi:predicted XRE-type DNA-binding protein